MVAPKLIIMTSVMKYECMRYVPIGAFDDNDKCQSWRGLIHKYTGYPQLWYEGKNYIATRIVYMIYNNIKEFDQCALHTCDHTWCVKGKHLFAGMQVDNNKDRDQKGRQVTQKGEKHILSKLTDLKVYEIKRMLYYGYLQKLIAEKFNVDISLISQIKLNKAWSHIKFIPPHLITNQKGD